MNFDCSKQIQKYHAVCCGPVPIDKVFYQITSGLRHRKIVAEREVTVEGNDFIIPFTQDLTCTYLDKNYKCSIYAHRPEVCKKFGVAEGLQCAYVKKDGSVRDGKGKRKVERDVSRKINNKLRDTNAELLGF